MVEFGRIKCVLLINASSLMESRWKLEVPPYIIHSGTSDREDL